MFGQTDSRDDYQPLGYLGRVPLYVTTVIVIVESLAMVALTVMAAANAGDFETYLRFSTWDIRFKYAFWQFLTYALVDGPSIWFVVGMFMLYSFGREVERFIGRASYSMLYLSLILLGPCVLAATGIWAHEEMRLVSAQTVNFAVFIAFCTIYPNVELLFSVKAKWYAAIWIGIVSLQGLRSHAVTDLMVFWGTCLAAFLFIKYLRGQIPQFSLRDYLRQRRSRRSLRAVPGPRPVASRKSNAPKDGVIESIDPLLDKIAKHGIGSLTERERERLEQAREELLKRPLP
jgi:membrane associated rhomboid family serine protease